MESSPTILKSVALVLLDELDVLTDVTGLGASQESKCKAAAAVFRQIMDGSEVVQGFKTEGKKARNFQASRVFLDSNHNCCILRFVLEGPRSLSDLCGDGPRKSNHRSA